MLKQVKNEEIPQRFQLTTLTVVVLTSFFGSPVSARSALGSAALCDVGNGEADLEAPPVQGPGQSEQSQDDEQDPGHVDGVLRLSGLPRPGHETGRRHSNYDEQQ